MDLNSPRRMAYPITLGAKLVHFPYKMYFQKNISFRMTCYAFLICLPIIYKIQRMTFAPSNVEKYNEYKRKEHEDYLKHLEHLY